VGNNHHSGVVKMAIWMTTLFSIEEWATSYTYCGCERYERLLASCPIGKSSSGDTHPAPGGDVPMTGGTVVIFELGWVK